MIIFDLKCSPQGHVFEAWFGSTEDYQSQQDRGLVACPLCHSVKVSKAPMSPRVGAKGNQLAGQSSSTSEMEAIKSALAALALAQKAALQSSENVGDRFPDEARAIHLGEADARSIHGQASLSEAEKLADEGITVVPLLFPLVEPGFEN